MVDAATEAFWVNVGVPLMIGGALGVLHHKAGFYWLFVVGIAYCFRAQNP